MPDTPLDTFARTLWEKLETQILDLYGFIPESARHRAHLLTLLYPIIVEQTQVLVEQELAASKEEIDELKAQIEEHEEAAWSEYLRHQDYFPSTFSLPS